MSEAHWFASPRLPAPRLRQAGNRGVRGSFKSPRAPRVRLVAFVRVQLEMQSNFVQYTPPIFRIRILGDFSESTNWRCFLTDVRTFFEQNPTKEADPATVRLARHTTEKYSLLFSFCLPAGRHGARLANTPPER